MAKPDDSDRRSAGAEKGSHGPDVSRETPDQYPGKSIATGDRPEHRVVKGTGATGDLGPHGGHGDGMGGGHKRGTTIYEQGYEGKSHQGHGGCSGMDGCGD